MSNNKLVETTNVLEEGYRASGNSRGGPIRDPFDKLYPITKRHVGPAMEYTIYFMTSVEAPHDVSEILEVLGEAEEEDTVIFLINNNGGYLSTTTMLVDAITHCKGTVVAECSGTVASAATMIALACEGLYISPHTRFMIHNYSGGMVGKGGELATESEFAKKFYPEFMRSAYEHFLTPEEIERVIDDKDKWLDTEEVRERWLRVISVKEAKMVAEQQAEMEESRDRAIENLKGMGYKVTKSRPKKKD